MQIKDLRVLPVIMAVTLSLGINNQATAVTVEKTDAESACASANNVAPIPPSEAALPTVTAEHFLNVDPKPQTLEGMRYGPDGYIYFCNVSTRRIFRMDPKSKKISPIVEFADFRPSGLAFHPRDGRLFFCGTCQHGGGIFEMNKDNSAHKKVLGPEAGYLPNDLVFDANGGIYFTDSKGNLTDPVGGVYYLSPDFREVKKVVGNIANANGIALAPKGDVLWISDYGRKRLYRVELENESEIDRIHSYPVYYFTGRGVAASIRTDSEGNLYAPMMAQGRILIFNQLGFPIGQILLPERENGHNLFTSSLDIDPASHDLYLVVRDNAGNGANIFKSEAFAKGKGLQQKIEDE